MDQKKRNPTAGDGRVSGNLNVLGGAFDDQSIITATLESTDLTAALVAVRYRLTPPWARLVCELANLGRRSA